MALRNKFFDWGIKPVKTVDAKVVSVGNLAVGGTGKTPHVAYISSAMSQGHKVAILLRGYGRKSIGFHLVHSDAKIAEVGDEALNYKKHFGEKVIVAVCEKRVVGATEILRQFPAVTMIVLDDAYQHRYIDRDCNILLTEYMRPFSKDFVLPSGRLREFSAGKNRADIIVVTKSPEKLSDQEKTNFIQALKVPQKTPVFFSRIVYGTLTHLLTKEKLDGAKNIVLVTGIGNPTPLLNHLAQNAEVVHIKFKDHYDFTASDIERIHKIFDNFVGSDKIIVTTEKDAMRLLYAASKKWIENYPWYWQPITVKLEKEKEFIKKVYEHIR